MPKCPFCGHELAPGAKKCYNCGYDREETMKSVEGMGCGTFIITTILSLLLAWALIEIFLKH